MMVQELADEGLFQSTLPARGATISQLSGTPSNEFQSTLPARGATRPVKIGFIISLISIHAPREGSDCT